MVARDGEKPPVCSVRCPAMLRRAFQRFGYTHWVNQLHEGSTSYSRRHRGTGKYSSSFMVWFWKSFAQVHMAVRYSHSDLVVLVSGFKKWRWLPRVVMNRLCRDFQKHLGVCHSPPAFMAKIGILPVISLKKAGSC